MKGPPRYKLGDRVRIARLLDETTSRSLIGYVGTITEIDNIVIEAFDGDGPVRLQVNYRVDRHYMHEEELEAVNE